MPVTTIFLSGSGGGGIGINTSATTIHTAGPGVTNEDQLYVRVANVTAGALNLAVGVSVGGGAPANFISNYTIAARTIVQVLAGELLNNGNAMQMTGSGAGLNAMGYALRITP